MSNTTLNDAPIQVHLIAPPLVCWGLQRLVQTAGAQFILVACSATLAEALPLLDRQPPDVTVLDMDDGYTADQISELYETRRIKVLAITCEAKPALLQQLHDAGARGVLQKREGPSALLKAIEAVGNGDSYPVSGAPRSRPAPLEPAMTLTSRHEEPLAIDSLTRRERQTFAAVMSDAASPVKVIADRLCISEHTLRNHLTSIYSKLGVSGRLALYAYANEHQRFEHSGTFRLN
jgi:two-component system, NarL family, nitrate/nitrite response regulator NarL